MLTAPIQMAIASMIRITMGRPVLFSQPRAGRFGHPFQLRKFRTMAAAQPGLDGPEHDADSTSRFGKMLRRSSLDELPSLWNVICGDMSLVGPRPLLLSYRSRYSYGHALRLIVRPGVTGWAQVNGRNRLTWEEKFELDVWYVQNRTLLLDLRILWRTVGVVLKRQDIDHSSTTTMPEFGAATKP